MYTSSIRSRYGDTDLVKTDASILGEIWGRQGSALLLDVVAEKTGEASNKYQWSKEERQNVILFLVDEFKNALEERL